MVEKILVALLINISIFQLISAQELDEKYLGNWGVDSNDMPYFSYTGDLPYAVNIENAKPALLMYS